MLPQRGECLANTLSVGRCLWGVVRVVVFAEALERAAHTARWRLKPPATSDASPLETGCRPARLSGLVAEPAADR